MMESRPDIIAGRLNVWDLLTGNAHRRGITCPVCGGETDGEGDSFPIKAVSLCKNKPPSHLMTAWNRLAQQRGLLYNMNRRNDGV